MNTLTKTLSLSLKERLLSSNGIPLQTHNHPDIDTNRNEVYFEY